MTWELTDADRKRIAADVAAQLKKHPGPLPPRAVETVVATLRAIARKETA